MTDLLNPTAMTHTFGSMPTSMPAGFFKAVQFPILAKLDETTSDKRRLLSGGADVRGLPLTIKYQQATADYGHVGAIVSGALFEVTVDPANNLMSGLGFLLNDEHGKRHARYIATGAMRGNSVDLAEVKARFVEDLDTGEYWIEFTEFALAATTGVATPAFRDAHATIDDGLTDEELVASMGDPMTPLVIEFDTQTINIIGTPIMENELTASAGTLAEFDAFYRPESDIPHKGIVDADGNVYGHLALWHSCWGDEIDRCVRPPRPNDQYASFNQPGVLTERGMVSTGPIFALGGHRPSRSAPTIEQAYGGIENAWCDVRIIEGKHGPWMSGRVRPGVAEDVLYAARASRLSGHWVNGALRAIVSVNVPAFNVAGASEAERELVAGFAFHTEGDEITELVASFPTCVDEAAPLTQLVFNFNSAEDMRRVAELLDAALGEVSSPVAVELAPGATGDENDLRVWADQKLADILDDDRDSET